MFKWKKKARECLWLPILLIFILYLFYSNKFTGEDFREGVMKWYNYTPDELNGPQVAMDDPKLLSKILRRFLIPPSESGRNAYSLSNFFASDPSMGQSEKILSILNNKKNGYFIEVGALDGETRSNTLYFERFLNWTGLLIEPDPLNFADLLNKNRHSWLSPTCLSLNNYPEIVKFEQNQNQGRIASLDVSEGGGTQRSIGTVNVQCFPLYSYLLALNVTYVDYLSLDVEGAELQVLKTIPFQKINIQTLSVEFAHVVGGRDVLSDYMFSQGYVVHSEVTHPDWLANDLIFMKI